MRYLEYSIESLNDLKYHNYHLEFYDKYIFLEFLKNSIELLESQINSFNYGVVKQEYYNSITSFIESYNYNSNLVYSLMNNLVVLLDNYHEDTVVKNELICLMKMMDYKLSLINYSNLFNYLLFLINENSNPTKSVESIINEKDEDFITTILFQKPVELIVESKYELLELINSSNINPEVKSRWIELINAHSKSTNSNLLTLFFHKFIEDNHYFSDNYFNNKVIFYKCYSSKLDIDYFTRIKESLITDEELDDLSKLGLTIHGLINDSAQNLKDSNEDKIEFPEDYSLGSPDIPQGLEDDYNFNTPEVDRSKVVIVVNNEMESDLNSSIVVDNIFTNIENNHKINSDLSGLIEEYIDILNSNENLLDNLDLLTDKLVNDYYDRGLELGLDSSTLGTPESPNNSTEINEILKGLNPPNISITDESKSIITELNSNLNNLNDIYNELKNLNNNLTSNNLILNTVIKQLDRINSDNSGLVLDIIDYYSNSIPDKNLMNPFKNDDLASTIKDKIDSISDKFTFTDFSDPDGILNNLIDISIDSVNKLDSTINEVNCIITSYECTIDNITSLGSSASKIINKLINDKQNRLNNKLNFKNLITDSINSSRIKLIESLVKKDKSNSLEKLKSIKSELLNRLGVHKSLLVFEALSQSIDKCDYSSGSSPSKDQLNSIINDHFGKLACNNYNKSNNDSLNKLGLLKKDCIPCKSNSLKTSPIKLRDHNFTSILKNKIRF